MANLRIQSPSQPAPVVCDKPATCQTATGGHLQDVKAALFGPTGSAMLAGAAAGALVGGLPGAAVGSLVGLGLAGFHQGSTSAAVFSGGAAVVGAAMAFPPMGAVLVGATAATFASGAAQQAAHKLGHFLSQHSPQPAVIKN